jgi:hypothetical protein
MKIKRSNLIPAAVCIGVFLMISCLYAAVSDDIKMENKAYQKHTKSIVTFSHKKHSTEYATANPELYKSGCGECHHDKDHNPLTSLKAGDAVQGCIECHKNPGDAPKAGKDELKLTDKDKLQYHAYALHENCKGCHKKANDATGKKTAPTVCTKCHLKAE